MTIGKATVISGQNPDTANPSIPICHCGINPYTGWGLAVGYWAPAAIVDVTRHPYCMVDLGGWKLPKIRKVGEGDVANYSSENNQSFYYFHYLSFPMMDWFSDVLGGSCKSDAGFGVGFISELDPVWNDEKLNYILYPEIKPIISHILQAQIAQAADCVASTAHLPLDSLYWSAGCQGTYYPIEGQVQEHVNSVQATTLISERGILLLHRLGLMQDSSPHSLCHENFDFFLPKSRYRYQMIYPVKKSCYPFGYSTATWSSGVVSSTSTEDYGYIIWKKRNCCAYS